MISGRHMYLPWPVTFITNAMNKIHPIWNDVWHLGQQTHGLRIMLQALLQTRPEIVGPGLRDEVVILVSIWWHTVSVLYCYCETAGICAVEEARWTHETFAGFTLESRSDAKWKLVCTSWKWVIGEWCWLLCRLAVWMNGCKVDGWVGELLDEWWWRMVP